MYGTLRHNRPPGSRHGSETYNSNIAISSQYGDLLEHTCGGASVVPPPPMFEEGNINPKTPLIAKKIGKGEKKDKMESRV